MHTSELITQTYQGPTYSPFGLICEQHVDEVISYWSKWQTAINQPLYNKDSLNILEKKIQENIAGMMTNACDSWGYIAYFLDDHSPAAAFAAAQIALRSYKTSRLRELMEYAQGKPELEQGLVSALVWMPQDIAQPWLRKFLKSKDLNHKALALRACRLRGEIPLKYLNRFLKQKNYLEHEGLYIQCLRIVGELKIHNEKDCLFLALKGPDPIRFWGLYSLVMLGEKHIARQLAPYIFDDHAYQEKAIDLVFRVLPMNEAWELITELTEHSQFRRQTLQALSCLGDPASLTWVLEQMKDPILARASAETFFNITGINLNAKGFSIEAPYSKEELYELAPGQTTARLEYDEHLPWPDTEKLWQYWHSPERTKLTPRKRYFLGQEIKPNALKLALAHSNQRQCQSAALELTLQLDDYFLHKARGIGSLER